MNAVILDPWQADSVGAPDDVRRLTVDDLVEREREGGNPFGPFHRSWLMNRSPEKVRRLIELARLRPDLVGMPAPSFAGFSGGIVANPSSFTAVSASATETQFWVPAIWTPIPADSMYAGQVYRSMCGGVFTSTGTQGLLTFTPRYGQSSTVGNNVSGGASNITAPPASLTKQAWYSEFNWTVRALGLAASGATVTGNGFALVQGAAAATGIVYVIGGTVAATIDNTAASGYVLDLTISVASQSYTCQWVTPCQALN